MRLSVAKTMLGKRKGMQLWKTIGVYNYHKLRCRIIKSDTSKEIPLKFIFFASHNL